MLDEGRLLEIFKRNGAEFKDKPGVVIADEEKTLEELCEMLSEHFLGEKGGGLKWL